uniref:G protein-coupled receptor n=1 Tax=Caenorhabditis tropicalis TaxID=1561998 RepID=A0A1I7T8Y7_9PELO
MKHFRGWRSLVWVLYCLFFGSIWSFDSYIALPLDEVAENYFKDEMLLRYDIVMRDKPVMPFLPFDPNNGSVRWRNVTYTITMTSIMIFQYSIMVYCGWKMNSKMEEKTRYLSNALKHHHRQLFKTLVLQITTPTIFLFSPLIFIIFLPFFEIKLSFPAGATACAFSIYPAMDSIIVLLVVSEYKFAAKRMWNSFLRKVSNQEMKNSSGSNKTTQVPISVLSRDA